MFTTSPLSHQSLAFKSYTAPAAKAAPASTATTSAASTNFPSSNNATLVALRTANARIQDLVQQHIVQQAIEDIKTPGGGGLAYVHQAEPWLLKCYSAFQGSNSPENLAQGPSTFSAYSDGRRKDSIIFTADGWITINEDKNSQPLVYVSNPNPDSEYFYRTALNISRPVNSREVSAADIQDLRQRLAQWLTQNANATELKRGLANFFEKSIPSSTPATLPRIAPQIPRHTLTTLDSPAKQALQEMLSGVKYLLQLPYGKFHLPKYQDDFAMLQMYLSLPNFDVKVLQKTIESLVHSMEEAHHIHTQLEQRIQKLACPLENNVRSAIHEIATSFEWAGAAGEIAPRLMPLMDNWPAHRILVIENADGAEQARFCHDENNDPIAMHTMPLTAENSVRIRQTTPNHYDAVSVTNDGRFTINQIPRDGNCLYNAILNGLPAREREVLLGDNSHYLQPPLLLRQRLAEFLIANENIRNRLPDILNMAAIPANEIEKKLTTPIAAQPFTLANKPSHSPQKKRAAPQSPTAFTENKKQRRDNATSNANAVKKSATMSASFSMAATTNASINSATQRIAAPQSIIQNLMTTPAQSAPANTGGKSVHTNTDNSALSQAANPAQKGNSAIVQVLRKMLEYRKAEKEYLKQRETKKPYLQGNNPVHEASLRQTTTIDTASKKSDQKKTLPASMMRYL